MLAEELTACGTILDLSRRLSVIRSRNISMSLVFQNLAGLQNRYPLNQWQELLGNCDVQLFLGCTDPLTAEFVSNRTGLASMAVTSKAKQLDTWRISNYTPEYRETSGVGKRPVLTPNEVLRLPIDQALVIILGKKILKVDKMDYFKHPEYPKLRSGKASAHIHEWLKQEWETAATAEKSVPKKTVRRRTKSSAPAAAPEPAPVPTHKNKQEMDIGAEEIVTSDKDSILI